MINIVKLIIKIYVMKKVTVLLFVLFTMSFVNAQSSKEEIDFIQATFGMEKKALVDEFVKVDASQKDAFWKLYDEYETARKDLGKKRIELFVQYGENFDKLTSEFADTWTKEVLSLSKKTDALLVSYYKKIKKVTNPVVALQFYQLEVYILNSIRLAISEGIPFPEMKK
jgi:hypothetical protein